MVLLAASFKTKGDVAETRTLLYTCTTRPYCKVNQGNATLAIKIDQSPVTFMHMTDLYSYFAASFKSLCHVYRTNIRPSKLRMRNFKNTNLNKIP